MVSLNVLLNHITERDHSSFLKIGTRNFFCPTLYMDRSLKYYEYCLRRQINVDKYLYLLYCLIPHIG